MLKKETIGSIEDKNLIQNHILFDIIFELASIEPIYSVLNSVAKITDIWNLYF